ncbi:MAG: beta-ketoacyl-ACP synthase III [Planctomycetota bacterium]|jgi:3-oxoacyl-[acyl-carrier-protein] synthase-3
MVNAIITGWGSACPQRVLTNRDLESMVNTNDEWIVSRTGIRERRIAEPSETSGTLGLKAAHIALAKAKVNPADLDLVIFATTTPDYLLPASGCLIQQKLGAERAAAFDLNAACSGFLYGLSVGSQFIKTGTAKRVLVIAAEVLSRFVNWADRSTCILFGDGAAAVVLEASEQKAGILSCVLGSRGDVEKMLVIEAGAGAKPATAETIAALDHTIHMRGNEVFKMAVRNMVQAARESLNKANLTLDDIKAIIPHQANLRILKATQESLGFPAAKMFVNLDRYGNTGAASIPIALCEYLDQTPPQAGDHFLFAAFGGGLTWGSVVLRWADLPS